MKIFQHRLLTVIILFQSSYLFSAFEINPLSTMNMALGRLKLNSTGNILDIINDPSSIVAFNLKGGEAIWNRPFQLKELQTLAFSTAFNYQNWGLGISASKFGNDIYNESALILGVARSFKTRLAIGANISIYQLKITDYGVTHAV